MGWLRGNHVRISPTIFICVTASSAVLSVMLLPLAKAEFQPPVQAAEMSFNLLEDYLATVADTGEVLNRQVLVGTQFWSLEHLSQRATVSAGPGVDKVGLAALLTRRGGGDPGL